MAEPARAFFASLIDYAGLFPPARLAMDAALDEYEGARAGTYGWIAGRFVVPASRLPELQRHRHGSAMGLSVVLDAALTDWRSSLDASLERLATAQSDARTQIESVEVRLPPDAAIESIERLTERMRASGLARVPVYCEVAVDVTADSLHAIVRALRNGGLRAKVRCGGVTADAFPTCGQLAAVIFACCQRGVAFKATAGLHHPARHFDPDIGVTMHGFLNVAGAAILGFSQAASEAQLQRILAESDAAAFRFSPRNFEWRDARADAGEIERARRSFGGFGSCSFEEPVADAIALGILK